MYNLLKALYVATLLVVVGNAAYAAIEKTIPLRDETELTLSHYPATDNKLFIWLAPEAGLQQAERYRSRQMAEAGIDVGYQHLITANVLPVLVSNTENMTYAQIDNHLPAGSSPVKLAYNSTS